MSSVYHVSHKHLTMKPPLLAVSSSLPTSTEHLSSHSEVNLPIPGCVVHKVDDIAVGLAGHRNPIHIDQLISWV